ncbi:MAG: hypothetical protein U1E65_08985 [Myxococcota bacterium]
MRAWIAVTIGLILGAGCATPKKAGIPVSPESGGIELGASGFVGSEHSTGSSTRVIAGPSLHVAVRGPVLPHLQLGLLGRFGLSSGNSGSGVSGAFVFEGRYVTGSTDWAPYLALGVGAVFRPTVDASGARGLVQQADPVIPVGLGIDLRLTDTMMLGISTRYTAILTELPTSVGPIDLTLCLVFL